AESVEVKMLFESTEQSLSKEASLESLLRRPEVDILNLVSLPKVAQSISEFRAELGIEDSALEPMIWEQVLNQLEVQVKYEGYIQKQTIEIANLKSQEEVIIPQDFDYNAISGLS